MQSTTLDIDRVLRDKLGSRARFVPRILVNYLKRIIHQDELNEFIIGEGDKQGVPWLLDCVEYLDMKLDVRGAENLPAPDAPPCTFVSNHPLGGQDGVALGAVLGKHYDGRIKYLVNDLLMNLHGLAPLCVPINKTGAQSRQFPAMVEAGFRGTDHIIMFPAGLCSRRQDDGSIRDLPWQKTFVTKSVETQRNVVPIHFSGHNSDRFYRIARWNARLGLKVNIAMLYLVDEMFRNRHKTFTITIGKPIPYTTFDRSRSPKAWAAYVQEEVYRLAQQGV
ncbi:MAG: glycerol acyltransferase [Alloprevotella sp.]|nr:glycerol acyltransferase [Alloprevotella sp.]